MASTNNTTTLNWSASSTKSLNTTARVDSDAISLNVEDWDGALTVLADNNGTPASGDVVDVYVKWSTDGTNYDTDEHAEWVMRLDTYPTNTPGEDPAQKTVALDVSGKKACKISMVAAQGATRSVTVSGSLNTHRPQ